MTNVFLSEHEYLELKAELTRMNEQMAELIAFKNQVLSAIESAKSNPMIAMLLP